MSSSENYPQKNNVQKSNLTNSQIIKRRQSRQEIEQIPIKPIQRKQENPTDKPWRQQPIQKKQEQQVDYVKKNYQELKQMEKTIRQNKEKQQFQQDNYQYGQVPEYIVQLKQQLAEQKLKQQQQKQYDELMKNVPKGCRLVPDDERQDLLQQLKQALNEEYKKYNSFPLRYDNTSIQQAKNECGQKIDELEQTIVQFERKGPLYIKI